MRQKTIIISGADGFIGSYLHEYLRAKNIKVVPLTRKTFMYTPKNITELQTEHNADIFIHAAGNSSVSFSQKNPDTSRDGSITLTQNILKGLSSTPNPPSIVFLSSAAVYGNDYSDKISEITPAKPISVYGEHKLACEKMIADYAKIHKKPSQIIRIFSLIGKNQRRLLPYELYKKFSNKNDETVSLLGSGNEIRDYLSIDAFTQKLHSTLSLLEEQKGQCTIINIASGQPTKTSELAEAIKGILKVSHGIEYQNTDIGENPKALLADTTCFDDLVSNNQSFDLKESLTEIIKHWQEHG